MRERSSLDWIVSPDARTRRSIARVLRRYGEGALRLAERASMRVVVLEARERYRDVSRALRRLGIDVDAWPSPPAGLFVVEERTVYLRSCSPMTVAHEFGHALDCALGGGVYLSGVDPRIRSAFVGATSYVTPYAASGLDEYFAEALRAHVEANDPASRWPRATRARLAALDPPIARYVEALFRNEFALPEGPISE